MHPGSSKRGQSVVEMAFVLPIFLFVLMGIFDFGRAFHSYTTLTFMVNNAARKASEVNYVFRRFTGGLGSQCKYTSFSHAALPDVIQAFNDFKSPLMDSAKLTFSQIGVGTASNTVTITGTYEVDLVTPFLGPLLGGTTPQGGTTITLFSSATEAKE